MINTWIFLVATLLFLGIPGSPKSQSEKPMRPASSVTYADTIKAQQEPIDDSIKIVKKQIDVSINSVESKADPVAKVLKEAQTQGAIINKTLSVIRYNNRLSLDVPIIKLKEDSLPITRKIEPINTKKP